MRAAGARANRRRGEIEAMVDGECCILCLTLGALSELETVFAADNLIGLAERFSAGRLKAGDMIRIIGAGLRGGGNLYSDQEVAEASVEGGIAGYAAIVGELLTATFADPQSGAGIRAARNAGGAAVFTWIRRGRADADNWIASDIPLDEPFERYRIEVLSGAAVKRQVEVSTPGWTYPLASEVADFGSMQTELSVRVRQMGQRIPLGLPATAAIAI